MNSHFEADNTLSQWAHQVMPYSAFIGLQVGRDAHGEILFALPFSPQNIGNVFLPALHGGLIGGFLESAAALFLRHHAALDTMPKIVDFSLDYLRSGKPETCYARCILTRQGSRIANVAIEGWQADSMKPVAVARVHFLMPNHPSVNSLS